MRIHSEPLTQGKLYLLYYLLLKLYSFSTKKKKEENKVSIKQRLPSKNYVYGFSVPLQYSNIQYISVIIQLT